MNLFGLSGILVGISSLSMSIFVFATGRNKKINVIWALYCLGVAFWGFGGFKAVSTLDYSASLFWFQISYIGLIFLPPLFLHFIDIFLGHGRNRKTFLCYVLSTFFLFVNFAREDLFLGKLNYLFKEFYWPNPPGIIWYAFFIFTIIVIGYSHYVLYRAFLATTNNLKRTQIRYFFIGSFFSWIGGFLCYLPCFGIYLYPFGNFGIIFYTIIYGYAIVKYRLMDIRIAFTRASIFIVVYTLILGLPFALAVWQKAWLIDLFGANWWMSPLGLMAVLATGGPFIYIYVQRKAEDRLLKEQRRYQDTLKQASVGMTRIRSLRKLLDLITHIVTRTVRIDYVAVYLRNKETGDYELQVMRDKGRVPIPRLPGDNPLIAWISVKREPIIYEEIVRQAQDTNNITFRLIEENMRILTASVIIPSFLEDKFMGFIVLGNKISGQIYTPDDLNVFQVLASQAALAIENAQFYEDAKEMQQQIAQAEKMATIGTMADGLSHQINNRFYALSLIAGDSIDTIKLTDTSKCTPEIKKMIEEINYALGRIQTNVVQGGEVVRGLLKYSRKGEEGLDALDLNKIIDNTLEMVQFKVKLSDIDIVRNFDNLPKIKGNMTQLEEVFFNFIDNANDAMAERKATLQEPGYRGKITISAQAKDGKVEIVFEDNGMGIKDADNKKIFTPFFTTKTSSRKGTGLGLYVINKIITDAHKGKIVFESAHKVGTRFIIELPAA